MKLQDTGETWLRYSAFDPGGAVPAAGVMAGDVAADTFTDKIVLVGISGLGVQDYKTTPLGEFVPGVHIHAQVIENLLANVSLVRPACGSPALTTRATRPRHYSSSTASTSALFKTCSVTPRSL